MKFEIEAITKKELHEELDKFKTDLVNQLIKELPKALDSLIDQKLETKLKNVKLVTT